MAIEPKVIKDNGITIIDPNPENQVVDHEDLYIYASLVAKTKGRSFLTEGVDGSSQENINISTVDMVVSDTATTNGKKRQFLTTAWSNIGGSQMDDVGNRGDLEGFGITNIDIEIKGSYIPRVIIDFVDIRGATLFEQGSCSPYGMFFHLPYPIFELTIKGYYGKPATYFLNLQKFNTKFNSETGNFECKAEFIGWSYAFLADMLMGYVRCSNYMSGEWGAKESLRKKYDEAVTYYIDNGIFDESDYFTTSEMTTIKGGPHDGKLQPFCRNVGGGTIECTTISNLLVDIAAIKIFLGQAKGDEDYKEIGNLIRVKNSLNSMKNDVRKFTKKLEDDHKGQLEKVDLTQASNGDNSVRNIKELYIFNQAPDDSLTDTINRFWNRPIKNIPEADFGEIAANVPNIKETLLKELDTGAKECGGKYVAAASNKDVNGGLTNCKIVNDENGELKYQMLDFLDKSGIKFQNGMMSETAGSFGSYKDVASGKGGDFYIDVGYLTSIIDLDIDTLSKLIEGKRNKVKEAIDEGVIKILGFRPTIRNIFTILSCNVENFVQLLLDVSIKAEEHHNEVNKQAELNSENGGDERLQLSILKKQSKGSTPKRVYPWPTYYDTQYKSTTSYSRNNKTETKEQYPGTNDKFKDWPEVRFVENFIEACNRLNKADEDLIEEKESVPGFDNYMPINPLESQLNGQIQLKYREKLKSGLEDSALDEVIGLTIAERMFMTLDFSYFDPVRYNQFNLGLGFTFNPGSINRDGKPKDYDKWNQRRLWFQSLYKINNPDEDGEAPATILTNIARIDAHNLLSCVTDVDTLTNLNTRLFSGNEDGLYAKIDLILKGQTENREDPTDGTKSWFNPNANYNDLSTNINPPNILEDNVGDMINYDSSDGYWAYYPTKGYIRLLGEGSARGLGQADMVTELRVNCDIRKMNKESLFRLYDQSEYDEKVGNGVDMSSYLGDDTIVKRREQLQEGLAEVTFEAGTWEALATQETYKYKIDEKTKLITFDGGDIEGIRLFTSLGIGVSTSDGGTTASREFNIEYSALPLYACNDKSAWGTTILASWGDDGAKNYPFAGEQYHLQNYNRTVTGNIHDSSVPARAYTLEVAGRGIFNNVTIYNPNGEEGYLGNSTTTQIEDFKWQDLDEDGVNKDIRYKWGDTSVLDGLIQLPIWSDNVNRYRKANTSNNFNIIVDGTNYYGNRIAQVDWGHRRPLTIGGSNNYKLKGPKLEKIITKWGVDPEVYEGGNGDIVYTETEIESRNLAYLYLASCKATPFISSGLAASTSKTGGSDVSYAFLPGGAALDAAIAVENYFDEGEQGTYDYVGESYPKAIRPFIDGQGVIKIPKVWVYGMGSVMWRWKLFMGAVKSPNGNIYWRNPAFKEEPIGLDPLAQPGHPGVACDNHDYSPMHGGGVFGATSWFLGRKNRSTTEDGSGVLNADISFANKLFKEEKGLWPSNINTKDFIQISSFSRGVTRIQGVGRALTAGNYAKEEPPNADWEDGDTFSIATIADNGSKEYEEQVVNGTMFDWWGVYANDGALVMKNYPNTYEPSRVPMSWGKDARYSSTASHPSNVGAWCKWMLKFSADDADTDENEDPGIWKGNNSYLEDWWNYRKYKYNGLELQMRSAVEASANSYWPMLWVSPWQHFYTEVISSSGVRGTRRSTQDTNTVVEQVLTFIPMDHMFRDYVGNFGYLGVTNGNYASRNIKATPTTFESEIPLSFVSLVDGGVNSDETINFKQFNVTIVNSGSGAKGESALLSAEGGKYNELMALLPTFVKESFVREFERWCDNEWRPNYLKIIDPVNFGTAGEDLLGKSYRMNGFNGAAAGDTLTDILGAKISADFVDPTEIDGNLQGFGITALNKKIPINNKEIKKLEDILVKQFYYAVIPTPRVFGLDVWNGDKSEINANGVSRNAFYANKGLSKKYLVAFASEWKKYYTKKRDELTQDTTKDDGSVLNDDDIKLSLYRSFKSIVDKWISSSTNVKEGQPSYFFNITDTKVVDDSMGSPHVPLAGHFTYVNRVMQEIGNKAVLDVIRLEKIKDNPKMSFYNLISDLLGENNFDFFPLPTYTNFANDKSDETFKDMFRTDTNYISKGSGPNFICMYVGGTSRVVSLTKKGGNCPADNEDMSYNDDGFSASDNADNSFPKPYEWQNPLEPLISGGEQKAEGRIEGKGVTAFRVAYGVENQNMFKSVELDQAEFSETNESLLVIDRLANGGNPGDKTNKGQNLHNLYLTRSYTCSVESMGNMMIQPLQYFELTNIPMFYGVYLITEVKHNIKPHYIGTTFKGVRQPLATVPIVEDISTAMSLSMKDIDPIAGVNVLNTDGVGGGGGSTNTNLPSVATTSIADVEFFDVGATNISDYYNHKWKLCKNCDKSLGGHTRSDGKWVAYNNPTTNLKPAKIEYVVLHWAGGPGKIEDSHTLEKRGLHYHYEINRDGGLWKLCDTKKVAYHGGNMNSHSIGISYVGGTELDPKNKKVYVRTVDDWNTEDLNLDGKRQVYKSKKQFAAIVQAVILACQEYPSIKYITSHHWFSKGKSDVGNAFPYDILINYVKQAGFDLTVKYSGTAPSNVKWQTQKGGQQAVSGDIDLSFVTNALEQELDGNGPNQPPAGYDPNKGIGVGIPVTVQSTGSVQNALQFAGQI